MPAQADQRAPLAPTPGPVTRIGPGAPGRRVPARTARVLVEIDLAGGRAPGVASALCAEISDLLAGHARSGETTVSASVSLGFGDGVARPAPSPGAPPSAPLFSAGDDEATGPPPTDTADTLDARGTRAPDGPPALRILAGRRAVIQDGTEVPLTRREFDLLAHLARHPRQVFSRAQLIDAVWGARYRYSERTIDVHVRRIRVKLSPTGPQIVTVRGVGYRLDHPERVAVLPGVE